MITTQTSDFVRARCLGRLGATVLVILGFLVVDEKPASAGCVTTCSGTAAVTVDPPLDCATFNVEARDCYCMAVVHVDNTCTFPLQASGFTFGCDSCDKLEPGATGAVNLLVHENGAHDWSLHMEGADGAHVAHVTFDVSSFDDSSGSCALSRSRAPAVPWLGMFGVLALVFARGRGAARRLRRVALLPKWRDTSDVVR